MPYDRIPGSLEDAIDQIKAMMGAKRAGEVAGVSDSLVQKWSNPHHAARPSWDQLVLLDAACLKECGRAPIREAYSRSIGYSEQSQPSQSSDLPLEVLEVTAAVGVLAQHVREAVAATSQNGRELSANETVKLMKTVECVSKEVRDVQNLLSQRVLNFAPHSNGSSYTALPS